MGEFAGERCQLFFSQNGIVHQTTCAYSPQQNGIVERKHKHLLQIARALLFQSALPLKFWTEAILTTTYLVNRLPTSVLQWKTPYEVLYHRLVDYSGVVFHEEIFPYKNHTEVATDCPLPIPIPDQDMVVQNSATPAYSSPADISTSLPVDNSSNHSHGSFPHISTETLPDFPRRSARTVSKPVWMNDFVCSSLHSVNVITHVAPSHSAFVASLSQLEEPKIYNQACQHSEWREALNAELKALETNHTWELVPLPPGKTAIGCRWVFKLKLKADGSVDRHKARLVAKATIKSKVLIIMKKFLQLPRP
ncbi:UNVERIFIED_CONTAM: Retrovirus-related Pol polyprotein from transposon RE1 [Sesamum radiatum]|uniref:Retrovirus-related Pol polyprotein from transposon RE1 n=1 Tax=Sesamum radiatum TaxID=300843 RepID=A0AAW2N090_SESRA